MKKILVIHQSAELYGSDRSLYDFLAGCTFYKGIEFDVCLPEEGPLAEKLRELHINVNIVPLVKVSRRFFTLFGPCIFIIDLLRSLYYLEKLTRLKKIDLVYSNTLAVLGGAFWAFFKRKPHVWHIREIIDKPSIVSIIYKNLVYKLSNVVICNSKATNKWISGKRHNFNSCVVWNGVDVKHKISNEAQKRSAKRFLGLDETLPLVLFVGRFNAWKGQELLVEAVSDIFLDGCKSFNLLLVGGSPPGQGQFILNLKSKIVSSPAAELIKIHPFTENICPYYQASDILVVPSVKPEPFGRVAIEGMAHGVPVIASNQGGLREIVVNDVTGLLVSPGSSISLADAIKKLIFDGALRQQMGIAGYERQRTMFTVEAYRTAVMSVFRSFYTN